MVYSYKIVMIIQSTDTGILIETGEVGGGFPYLRLPPGDLILGSN